MIAISISFRPDMIRMYVKLGALRALLHLRQPCAPLRHGTRRCPVCVGLLITTSMVLTSRTAQATCSGATATSRSTSGPSSRCTPHHARDQPSAALRYRYVRLIVHVGSHPFGINCRSPHRSLRFISQSWYASYFFHDAVRLSAPAEHGRNNSTSSTHVAGTLHISANLLT